MTVEISYFKATASDHLPVAKDPGSAAVVSPAQGGPNPGAPAESVSITATPALSGVTPDGQKTLSILATEACRYEYSYAGRVTVTATSNYIAAGERLWLTPHDRFRFSLRTA